MAKPTRFSLLGEYLLYAALFSQAVMIHPYLFDLLLFTPRVLVLFAVAPALIESMTEQRGLAVVAVFFVAAWVSMVQLRRYEMQYPRQPTAAGALRDGRDLLLPMSYNAVHVTFVVRRFGQNIPIFEEGKL